MDYPGLRQPARRCRVSLVPRQIGWFRGTALTLVSVWMTIEPLLVVCFPPFDGWDTATILTYVGVSAGFVFVIYAFWQAMQAELH